MSCFTRYGGHRSRFFVKNCLFLYLSPLIRQFCTRSSDQADSTYKDPTTGRTRLRPKISFLLMYQGQVLKWTLLAKVRTIRAVQLKNTSIMASPAVLQRVKATAVRRIQTIKPKTLKRTMPVPEDLNDSISSMPALAEFSQHSVLESTLAIAHVPDADDDEDFDDSLEELFVPSPVKSAKKRKL